MIREEAGQQTTLYTTCVQQSGRARNSLSLVRRSCTEHRFGKMGDLHREPADKRGWRVGGQLSMIRIPASDRDLLPWPAHFSYITSVPEFNVVV